MAKTLVMRVDDDGTMRLAYDEAASPPLCVVGVDADPDSFRVNVPAPDGGGSVLPDAAECVEVQVFDAAGQNVTASLTDVQDQPIGWSTDRWQRGWAAKEYRTPPTSRTEAWKLRARFISREWGIPGPWFETPI